MYLKYIKNYKKKLEKIKTQFLIKDVKYNKFLLIYNYLKKKKDIQKFISSLKNIKNKSFKYKYIKKYINNKYLHNQHLIYKPKISNSLLNLKLEKRKKIIEKLYKRNRKYLPYIIIHSTTNNLFMTVVSAASTVINSISCGRVGFVGPRKTSTVAAETVGRFTGSILIQKKIRLINILLNTRTTRMYHHAFKGLSRIRRRFFYIYKIIIHYKKPHNGMRIRKLRRT